MKKFLEFNNYEKILELAQTQSQSYRYNWEEEIYIKAKKSNLLKIKRENSEIGKLNKNGLEPKKVKIPENEYYKENDEYFSEFILVDKNFYNNFREILDIPYYIISKYRVNLIILKDVFIYKISNKILGYGRFEKEDGYLIFKVKYLEILDEKFEYNYKTEIATLNKTKNFEEYLKIQRHIYFINSDAPQILFNQEQTLEIGQLFCIEKDDNISNNIMIKSQRNKISLNNFRAIFGNNTISKENNPNMNSANQQNFTLKYANANINNRNYHRNSRYINNCEHTIINHQKSCAKPFGGIFFNKQKNSIFFNK